MERQSRELIRLNLRAAETHPALAHLFALYRASGAVITEITADSQDDLATGRVTVQARVL